MTAGITNAKLRAWWHHRQALDRSLDGAAAADVLAATGWARSVGGSAPYLGLFARAGLDRTAIDDDVAALRIHELPSARGCTYVLPHQDFAVGLTVGAGVPEADLISAQKHLGVAGAEIDRLCDEVMAALEAATEPLDPAKLKKAVGDDARSLGEEGRKRGQSSTLPIALGLLQGQGRIHRVPVNGRLDQQRFGYVPWQPSPRQQDPLNLDTASAELARRYFDWAAPASMKHFRWFAGLTAADAKQAVAKLDLVPVEGTELLLPAELATDFEAFTVPRGPSYALVGWIDGIHMLHRDLGRLLDPEDAARPAPGDTKGRTLGQTADPPCPIIVDRGRVVGLWEYEPDDGEIVSQSFTKSNAALREAVERTGTYIREQLGDARGSSLDSPTSRAPRIAALRSA
jgi:hypothetical protein